MAEKPEKPEVIVIYDDEMEEGEEETWIVYAGIRDVYDLIGSIAEAEGRPFPWEEDDDDEDDYEEDEQ
jgi:hypothetical protein